MHMTTFASRGGLLISYINFNISTRHPLQQQQVSPHWGLIYAQNGNVEVKAILT